MFCIWILNSENWYDSEVMKIWALIYGETENPYHNFKIKQKKNKQILDFFFYLR